LKKPNSLESFKNSPHPSFKHTTYFDVYDRLLSPYKDKEICFVEVGVLNGGSLFMWRDFFGPKARIIGIDLNPAAKKWEKHGFEIYTGSQSDPDFWDNFILEVGPIDIFLDDGGHTYLQQIISAECLLQNIADGGMLIVEDTHTSYMDGFGDKKHSFIHYAKLWVDKINTRFGKFNNDSSQSDRRVWSVEFFESIVAFKVNKAATKVKSEPVWNKKPVQMEDDFRYQDRELLEDKKSKISSILDQAFSIYQKRES